LAAFDAPIETQLAFGTLFGAVLMTTNARADKKVRWGIVSTAGIGMNKVVPAIMKSRHSEVVALASRELKRAEDALKRLGLPQARAHGSYEMLLADSEVDAIYNPLPNHLHVPLTIAAARAGKHVLCEKPIGLNAADAAKLREIPPSVQVAEAFMIRFHPQWLRAREIVRSGALGEVRAIRGAFTYYNIDAANVRNAEIGGGGILDIGCYPIVGARFLLDAEPARIIALIERDPVFRTDRFASVIADFGDGRQLSFVCSTQLAGHQSIEVLGTTGRLEIVIPFNPPADQSTAILIDKALTFDGSLAQREIIPPCDQYTMQAEAFALSILKNEPFPFGIEDAIQNMRILDAIFTSEKSGEWAQIGS
jgi:predicted dehydrogenase